MPDKAEALNNVLVKLFNRILSIEEEAITKASALGVTMSEIHVIDAIGDTEARSMSEVAADLGVTMGTLTASVNRLVHKGHVTRSRPDNDRRVVLVTLTGDGLKAHEMHERFHMRMVDSILKNLSEEEQRSIVLAAQKLYEFFMRINPEDLLYEALKPGGDESHQIAAEPQPQE
ncbi:MAG: Multiple antibiotic resistance protein MarR [Firmicutes bacterium ADurb.Bin506]|jgi:DNA-binding MarR family transcriptional regulator|nr:MAG: Multiple antibiotic resistance protein MarR [Firmicutes bacterium ADurb.Bin506]